MDHLYEQLVKADKTGFYKTVQVATYAFGFIALASITVNYIISIILIVAAVTCFFYKKKLYVEYEYRFITGEIQIDKIVEMKKRSKIVTFNIREVALLALEDSDYVKDFSNKPESIVKCYSNTSEARVYIAMITEGNNKMQLMFMPDEKFLNLCYRSNPRVVKK
ncbi:DUF6106 family protein [Clostridium sp.]|uniref:DUF6106 family protein n=1 Tax=Clostridium sp. TaxID=1506 RepID=UPI003D6D4458